LFEVVLENETLIMSSGIFFAMQTICMNLLSVLFLLCFQSGYKPANIYISRS